MNSSTPPPARAASARQGPATAVGAGGPAFPEVVDVLGVPVRRLRLTELLEMVAAAAAERKRITVMYANVHVINTSRGATALRAALCGADLVYCDGEGVRLGARLLGTPLPERMTGADLLWDLAAMAERRGLSLFWIGGEVGVAESALARLVARHPDLRVVGSHHGFFQREGPESEALLEEVRHKRPDIVLVGLGTPAQELWVARHREALEAPVCWCIGAAADFVAGRVRRAPAWLRRARLEWLFRLLLEPRRLLGRYLLGNPIFLLRILRRRLCTWGARRS